MNSLFFKIGNGKKEYKVMGVRTAYINNGVLWIHIAEQEDVNGNMVSSHCYMVYNGKITRFWQSGLPFHYTNKETLAVLK